MVISGKTIKSDESRFACSSALMIPATLPAMSPLVVLICPIVTRIDEMILAPQRSAGILARKACAARSRPLALRAHAGGDARALPSRLVIHLAIIERREGRDQRSFEAHRT